MKGLHERTPENLKEVKTMKNGKEYTYHTCYPCRLDSQADYDEKRKRQKEYGYDVRRSVS